MSAYCTHWLSPDGDGQLTAWDEDVFADGKPVALARQYDVHPKVWALLEATAVSAPAYVDAVTA